MMSPHSNVVSISAFLLWRIVWGDTENTKYSPQFHPTTYFAKDVKRALNAFGAAEKFTWPDLRLLDLHEYNPEWTSGSMRLERLKLEMEAFRPKTLHRSVYNINYLRIPTFINGS